MRSDDPSLPNNEKLVAKLRTAIKHARATCVLGAPNKYDDLIRTSGWSVLQPYLSLNAGGYKKGKFIYGFDIDLEPSIYFASLKGIQPEFDKSHWFYSTNRYQYRDIERFTAITNNQNGVAVDPVMNKNFNIGERQIAAIYISMMANITRHGTCETFASLILMWLWQHSEGINRIEIMHSGFDHAFVVVNRIGDINDPSTWGDAWILDGWFKEGIVYPACEYVEKMKEIQSIYDEDNKKLYQETNLTAPQGKVPDEKLVLEVIPSKHHYPSENQFKSVFDYYEMHDDRFLPLCTFDEIRNLKNEISKKMQPVFTDIHLFNKNKKTIKPSEIDDDKKAHYFKPVNNRK